MHFTKYYSRTIAAAALGALIFSLAFTSEAPFKSSVTTVARPMGVRP